MTVDELKKQLDREIDKFPAEVSVLLTDLTSGEVRYAHAPETQVVSASTIKLAILLTALDQVAQGTRKLSDELEVLPEDILPDTAVFERGISTYTLWELLYWMIVESDNTATNVCIEALGYDAINAYCHNVLKIESTGCRRKMLDFDAVKEGRNNYTSAADQYVMYHALYSGKILTPKLRTTALNILRRQRCNDAFLRYIADPVTVAHKTGGLDFLAHDAGVFELPGHPYYLGVFTWNGPSKEGDPTQKQFIGRLAKAVYETYNP
ncbi:MAG: serine hydrolase [Oscillospiraceae bacterium]